MFNLKTHVESVHEGKNLINALFANTVVQDSGFIVQLQYLSCIISKKRTTEWTYCSWKEKSHANVTFVKHACFSEKYTTNKHIESVHEGKQPFKCDDCGKAFLTNTL